MRRSSRFANVALLVCIALVVALGILDRRALSAPPAPEPAPAPAPSDIAGLHLIESQIKSVVAKALPAVVAIRNGDSSGSGVIVTDDGIVMTAGHVVRKPGLPVTFRFADGKTAKGTTLGVYGSVDAGLVKITDPGKWPAVERGRSDGLKLGSWCVAIGHPLGYQEARPPVVRVGRILQITETIIQTDCPLVVGDSGGPLLDLDGKVIGINSRIGGPTDVNFHVPVDLYLAYWDRLVKGDAWQHLLPIRDGLDVKTSFRQVVGAANQCVVRVKCDGQDAALGTIVGPDGWVVTKASELKGKVVCRLRDGRELEARIVGINEGLDVAMLRIDAFNLPILPWSTEQPGVGQWLASAGMGDDPLAVGILGVPRRAIPPAGGVIGIMVAEKDGLPTIEKLVPQLPAEKAGLKASDVITHIDGEATANREVLHDMLRRRRPGDVVKLTVKRGDQTLDVPVPMIKPNTPAQQRQQLVNRWGVGVSTRSDDFPVVLQHDTVLRPVDCGGPVVDLTGKAVGINIAHAGRTETYSIPSDVLTGAMYELMSGRLSPPLLEAARKAEEKAAAEKAAAEKKVAEEKAAAEKKAAEEKAVAEKVAAEKKAAEEKAAAEKKAAEEKAAAEKAAAEKKAAEEKAAAERKAAEQKAAAEKAAAEKAAAEKKAAEAKAAADKAAAEKKAAGDKSAPEKQAPEAPKQP